MCIFAKMEVSFTVKYRCTHNSTDKNVKVSSEQSLARCGRSSEKIINACMKVILIMCVCVCVCVCVLCCKLTRNDYLCPGVE